MIITVKELIEELKKFDEAQIIQGLDEAGNPLKIIAIARCEVTDNVFITIKKNRDPYLLDEDDE